MARREFRAGLSLIKTFCSEQARYNEPCLFSLEMVTMSLARRSFLLSSLALAVGLTGCGFHLRGRVTLPIETMFVNLPVNNQMAAEIRRMLKGGTNITLVDTAEEADAILELVSSGRNREVVSLNMRGEAREYELTLQLTFRLINQDGAEFLPPTTFTGSRDMTYNEEDYLSRDAEEAMLYREIQQDLITQLLNRLATIKPISDEY